jgi:hypothetical protein
MLLRPRYCERRRDRSARAQMDLQEFSAAIARIEDGVLGRFGSAIRLFEAVAFGTQRQSQVSVVAEGRVSYVSWTIAELERVLAAQPTIAAKLQAIWAVKLAMKLKETTAYIGLGEEPAGAGAAPAPRGDDAAGAGVKAGDYGFPSSFLWGSGGDFGPLEIAVRPRASRPIAPAACARPRARRWAQWSLGAVSLGAASLGAGRSRAATERRFRGARGAWRSGSSGASTTRCAARSGGRWSPDAGL